MKAVSVLVCAVTAVVAASAVAEERAPDPAGGSPTVAVIGEATDDVKPDVAIVSLSIEVEKPTAAEAANENARRAEAVIAGLKAAGIADRDIATVGLSLYPVWSSQTQPHSVSAYQATNRVTVKVQPLDKAGALIARAVESGGEYQGLSFDVSDREARADALRAKAVENAAHRAALYASGAAMKLGPLLSIRADAAQPVFRPLVEASRMVKAAGGSAPPPIEPGLITLTETVSATWALAPP